MGFQFTPSIIFHSFRCSFSSLLLVLLRCRYTCLIFILLIKEYDYLIFNFKHLIISMCVSMCLLFDTCYYFFTFFLVMPRINFSISRRTFYCCTINVEYMVTLLKLLQAKTHWSFFFSSIDAFYRTQPVELNQNTEKLPNLNW